jgi:lipid A 3-O-deacylase
LLTPLPCHWTRRDALPAYWPETRFAGGFFLARFALTAARRIRTRPKTRPGFVLPGIAGIVLLAAATVAFAHSAGAEEPQKNSETGTLNLVVENDSLAGRDQDYTSGIQISWTSGPDETPSWAVDTAHWLPLFADDGDVRINYGIGQNIYTPRDISLENPPANDRPYAGWLYGSIGLMDETETRLDQLQLQIGMVGPASLADKAQTWVHGIINSTKPRGWDHQINNEPGIVLTYLRSWRAFVADDIWGLSFDATPHLGGAVGNVFTYANGGATFRFGWNMPDDYGPPRIEPAVPVSGFFEPQGDFGFYIFAVLDGRVVARNIFLDGNTFQDSRSVDKNILVGEAQVGIAFTIRAARLAYTRVFRTPEFSGQDNAEKFGAISLSLRF